MVDGITYLLAAIAVACMVGVWRVTRPSNEPRRAVDHYAALVRRNPREPNSRYELGLALMRRGSLSEAIHEFRLVTEIAPKHAPAHHRLGTCLMSIGNVAAALPHLEKATALSPIYAEAHASLGAAHELRGDRMAARGSYLRAVGLDPKLAIAHFNLARLYAQEGNAAKALAALQDAARADVSMVEEAKCSPDFDRVLGDRAFRAYLFGAEAA